MKILSKQLIGYCPFCGSDLSDETGTEVGVGDWTCHKVRLLTTLRNGAKYYKCPDCKTVWEAVTGRQLSDGEIESLGLMGEIEKKPKWSKVPGCFERHLQRRYGNILFPPERRRISKEEIEQARKRDEMDKERFINEILEFEAEIRNSLYKDDLSTLQKVQAFLEEAGSIGGDIRHVIKILENLEGETIKYLIEKTPEKSHLLERMQAVSNIMRTPFIRQLGRKDTPILESEEVPALLSEDLLTISLVGLGSRSFAPNFKPSTADIKIHLYEAVRQGFDKEYAEQIINAWNRIPAIQDKA